MLQQNNDPIAELLNIEPLPTDITPVQEEYVDPNLAQVRIDFDLARDNIKTILLKGNEALDDLLQLAKASQHPRSYEVLANTIKILSETNKDLLNVSKQYQELTGEKVPDKVTNNLWVGTPAELLKIIKNNQDAGPEL